MYNKVEKELHALWKNVKTKHEPHPHMHEDIDEFLNAGEWGLALEQIIDYAKVTHSHAAIKEKIAEIRQLMKA